MPESVKRLDEANGFFIPSKNINEETRDVYVVKDLNLKQGEKYDKKPIIMNKETKAIIEKQIDVMIKLKYNFIHYNGFPDVHKKNLMNILIQIL